MRRVLLTVILASAFIPATLMAQETSSAPKYKLYGFIRNYFAFDTRESESGTLDLMNFIPKDRNLNVIGDDLNKENSFRFLALTSRVGLDVTGYQFGNMTAGAKVEADFYCMNGNTATMRLRQAYMNLGFKLDGESSLAFKIGQAWHPMAADMADVICLTVGAPFGPFSRTPQLNMEYRLSKKFSMNLAGIWQMQYLSSGPEGASAKYIKYGGIPEIYLGANYTSGPFLFRAGLDVLSIKPRNRGRYMDKYEVRASDRITTASPFLYAQYKRNLLTVKAKTVFSQAGEHMNLMSGYALSKKVDDTSYIYTPYRTSSSWVNLSYGKTLQGVLLLGYIRNFGTSSPIFGYNPEAVELARLYGDEATVSGVMHGAADKSVIYFNKSAWNLNRAFRVAPNVIYNYGKLTLGLEYEITSVQYGDKSRINLSNGLADLDLHWVTNNRVTFMTKFSF